MVEETNWADNAFGIIEGDDLEHVLEIDHGQSYEWDEFHVWWSPSRRRYFWYSGAGCSCNWPGDDIRTLADLQDGTKQGALRAAQSWGALGVEMTPLFYHLGHQPAVRAG